MRTSVRRIVFFLFVFLISMSPQALLGQTAGNAGTIVGTVTDPAGAVVPNATVSVSNPVSEYSRTLATDKAGQFQFTNLPFNPYHVTVSSYGVCHRRAGCRCTLYRSRNAAHFAEDWRSFQHRDGRG